MGEKERFQLPTSVKPERYMNAFLHCESWREKDRHNIKKIQPKKKKEKKREEDAGWQKLKNLFGFNVE